MFAIGLFVFLLQNLHAEGSQLVAPDNVTMATLNTNYTLRWDWDRSWSQDVTFTAAYIPAFKLRLTRKKDEWVVVCANVSGRSCDFSGENLLYIGEFRVRVRAHANGTDSKWVSLKFRPDSDAQVGPPSRVALTCSGSNIDVHIDDPLDSSNNSMKMLLPYLYFNILYWEGPSFSQSPRVQNRSSMTNLVTLSGLKEWTLYCVAVRTLNNNVWKESSFTPPLCVQTEGVTAWWVVVLCFLLSMGCCFVLVFVVYKAYRFVKGLFFPSIQLPTHFREYLCDSPGSDLPRLLAMDSDSEQMCDKVVVCPLPEGHYPPAEVVTAPPSGSEEDGSHGYGLEGSGGSVDSGIYSSDSGSSVSQTSGQQTSSDVFWTSVCNQEELKMEVRAAGGR